MPRASKSVRQKEEQTKEKDRAERDGAKKIVQKGGAQVQLMGIHNALSWWSNIENILKWTCNWLQIWRESISNPHDLSATQKCAQQNNYKAKSA